MSGFSDVGKYTSTSQLVPLLCSFQKKRGPQKMPEKSPITLKNTLSG